MLKAAQGVTSSLRGLNFAQYVADENLRLATERRVEIICEAARRMPSPLNEAGYLPALCQRSRPSPERQAPHDRPCPHQEGGVCVEVNQRAAGTGGRHTPARAGCRRRSWW